MCACVRVCVCVCVCVCKNMLGTTLETFYTSTSSRKNLPNVRLLETKQNKTKTYTYRPSVKKRPHFPYFLYLKLIIVTYWLLQHFYKFYKQFSKFLNIYSKGCISIILYNISVRF